MAVRPLAGGRLERLVSCCCRSAYQSHRMLVLSGSPWKSSRPATICKPPCAGRKKSFTPDQALLLGVDGACPSCCRRLRGGCAATFASAWTKLWELLRSAWLPSQPAAICVVCLPKRFWWIVELCCHRRPPTSAEVGGACLVEVELHAGRGSRLELVGDIPDA